MKLNLGGGGHNPEGFIEVDRTNGQEIFPLPYEDGVAEVIRASHCLEHFSHKIVSDVVCEWVRVLKPGGTLQIAVPDFRKICLWYAEGRKELPLQLYLMGGQRDESDYHKTVFEYGLLKQVMEDAGLVDIKPWTSDLTDCASWEVSLNLQGTKAESNWIESISLWNKYSQFGEDAILRSIFDRIGASSRPFCVDVGAADGILFSNVRQWLEQGWEGLLIEADESRYKVLVKNSSSFNDTDTHKVHCLNEKVEPGNFGKLLTASGVPKEFDLLNVDIDGQDFYLWNSLLDFRPRVVVIEYDPEADPMFIPAMNGKGQAGSKAMMYVAAARGYLTVKKTETNLICIRKDICERAFNKVAEVAQPQTEELIHSPAPEKPVQVTAVISVPRLGINANWHATIQACIALGIKVQMVEGVFWGSCLTRGIEQAIAEGSDVILTIDYDSVFTPDHVIKLLQLLYDQDEFDCIVPHQIKRECNDILLQTTYHDKDFNKPLTEILTGHFGLTVFDAKAFAKLKKPWFWAQPNANGEWGDGKIDDDIYFWKVWRDAGLRLASANEVKIGHLEFMISWATNDMKIYRQSVTDYRKNGQPPSCGGNLKV